jgi:ribosomal protein L11 methyltransferase
LQRAPATYVARLSAAEADARRIADLLTESLDPARAVCAAFEAPADGWRVEVHFVAPLNATALRVLIASAIGRVEADALVCTPVAHRDWVAASLEGLPPVRAGRFVVHGAHDRARVPANCIGIEIEAALAFGTGHHATTRGCLLAIDGLVKRTKPLRILDLGTGTGVLAIALAKTLRTRILATDIDIRAVHVARANARNNRIAALIETVHAVGFNAPRLARDTRFDFVLANILLGPLQRLAAPIARRLAPGARVVLSGLLAAHANAAIAAYRAQGLALERRIKLDGWVTLVMKRRASQRS